MGWAIYRETRLTDRNLSFQRFDYRLYHGYMHTWHCCATLSRKLSICKWFEAIEMQSAVKESSFRCLRHCFWALSERCAREDGVHGARSTELLFLPLFRPWMVKYTHLYVKMHVFASILLNTVIQVLSESKQLRMKTCVTVIVTLSVKSRIKSQNLIMR